MLTLDGSVRDVLKYIAFAAMTVMCEEKLKVFCCWVTAKAALSPPLD